MNIPEQAVDALENELECHEIWSTHDYFECECGHRLTAVYELAWPAFRKHRATAALEAALPHIRAQIAADIRHQKTFGYNVQQREFDDALEFAARIAEEGTTK